MEQKPEQIISFYGHVGEIYEHRGHVYVYSHKSSLTQEPKYYYVLKEELCYGEIRETGNNSI